MTLSATLKINGDTLSLSGVLDYDSVIELDNQGRNWFKNAAPAQCKVDLEAVTYSNSAGIALLLSWQRAAQQQHKSLGIKSLPPNMLALLKLGELENFLMMIK